MIRLRNFRFLKFLARKDKDRVRTAYISLQMREDEK